MSEQDTREKLEVDVERMVKEHSLYWLRTYIIEWLDRQAVITEREASERHKKFCAWCEQVTDGRIAELTAEVEKQRQRANDAERGVLSDEWYVARDRYEDDVAELTAERDKLRKRNEQLGYANTLASKSEARKIEYIDQLVEYIDKLEAECDELQAAIDAMGNGQFYAMYRRAREERDALAAKVDELNAHWRKSNDGWAEANAEAERWRQKCDHMQRVIDTQPDSFLKMEREYRELQDVCGELERTLENLRGVK